MIKPASGDLMKVIAESFAITRCEQRLQQFHGWPDHRFINVDDTADKVRIDRRVFHMAIMLFVLTMQRDGFADHGVDPDIFRVKGCLFARNRVMIQALVECLGEAQVQAMGLNTNVDITAKIII